MKKILYEGNDLRLVDGKFALAWHNEKLEVISFSWARLVGKEVEARWRYETGTEKGQWKVSVVLVRGVRLHDTRWEALKYRKDWKSPFVSLPDCAVKTEGKKK